MARLFGRGAALARRHPGALDGALLALLSFPAWRPLLAPGYLITHDGLFHLFRLAELDAAVRSGVLYPRVAPGLALGYDYPVFNYYPPLSLYLAEVFRLAGLGYLDAAKAPLLLAVVGAGWAMYLLARELLPRAGALVAGLAYAYLPYLLLDVYVRGALAETLALALLPLVLRAFRRLALAATPGRVAAAAVSLAALALAHNVTTLLAAPLLAGAWLLWLAGDRRALTAPRRWLAAGAAVALGLALAALYWVPALLERELVASGRLTAQFFDYREHFQPLARLVQTSLAYDYRYDFQQRVLFRAGLVQVALAGAGWLAALGWRRGRPETLFWGAVLAGGVVLQWSRTEPLWELAPLAAYVQFPWRLLAPVGVASALLTGGLASVAAERLRPRWLGWAGGLALAALLAGSASASLQPARSPIREAEVRPATAQRIELDRRLVAFTLGEYLPAGAAGLFERSPRGEPDPAAGALRLTLRAAGPFHLELDAVADGPARLILDRFYFPGWQATVDGQPAPTQPAGPLALLAVDVPPGEHRLRLWLGDTPLRAAAGAVSALALAVLAGLLLGAGARGWPRLGWHLAGAPAVSGAARPALRLAAPAPLAGLALLGAGLLVVALASSSGATAPGGAGPAADFGPDVRLAGVVRDAAPGPPAGDRLRLTLYWQARRRPARDYVVALRLVDRAGRVVGRRDKRPQTGLRPTLDWEAGELVRDHQELALAAGAPAGELALLVGLRDAAAGVYLRPSGGPPADAPAGEVVEWRDGADAGVGLRLGSIESSGLAPATSPVGPALARAASASFGGQIALESWELRRRSADRRELPLGSAGAYVASVGQGERLQIQLRWRALGDLGEDYAVFTHLLDARQQLLAQDDEWPHRGFYPTTLWLPGEVVDDEYEIQVPATAPPGRYDLSVGLYRRGDLRHLPLDGGAADRLSLGWVKVTPAPALAAEALPIRERLDLELGGEATLLGYRLALAGAREPLPPAHRLPPGTRLALTLYWRALRRPTRDYTVFVHLYDGPGALRAQADGEPSAGNYPTTLWEPGEVVADEHLLTLPADAQPGRYRLAVGLYDLAGGARLRLPTGADVIPLQGILVGPEPRP